MKSSLIHSLHRIGAIKLGEFILKSGKASPIYIDLRLIISYPDILRQVADLMWQKIHDCKFDLICGIPYTALPIATCLSLQHNIPMVMRRKEKKTYGTKQAIEGAYQNGQRCLLVEDIITTGGSILETAEDIQAVGLITSDVVVLIDREQGALANLAQHHFNVHAVLTLSEILQGLVDTKILSLSQQQEISKRIAENS